jgi:hypothetical protein
MARRIEVDNATISRHHNDDGERPVMGNLSNHGKLTAAMPRAASVLHRWTSWLVLVLQVSDNCEPCILLSLNMISPCT